MTPEHQQILDRQPPQVRRAVDKFINDTKLWRLVKVEDISGQSSRHGNSLKITIAAVISGQEIGLEF